MPIALAVLLLVSSWVAPFEEALTGVASAQAEPRLEGDHDRAESQVDDGLAASVAESDFTSTPYDSPSAVTPASNEWPASSSAENNPIAIENERTGTTAWKLSDPTAATAAQIKGFASVFSVKPGDSLVARVTTNHSGFTADIYRLGWYSGLGGRLVTSIGPFEGVRQAESSRNTTTNLVWAAWGESFTLTTGTDWTTGYYLIKLTTNQGSQNYIPFVVQSLENRAPLLVHSSEFTAQAYNAYGGSSLYKSSFPGFPRAYQVSMDRPFEGDGMGQWARWEIPMVRWLEQRGEWVDYAADSDIHANKSLLLAHRGVLTVGHDEYWTRTMRDNFEAARNASVNLGFFAANSGYWAVRLSPSLLPGAVPNRVITGYKDANIDPVAAGDPSNASVRFRDFPIFRPERDLFGVQYENGAAACCIYFNLTLEPGARTLFGDEFVTGTKIPGIVGYEWDRYLDERSLPANLFLIGSGTPTNISGAPHVSHSTMYQYPTGALVFSSGTIGWSRGLDNATGVKSDLLVNLTGKILETLKGNATPLRISLPAFGGPEMNTTLENQRPGTTAWALTDATAATQTAIKGYGSPFSIAAGESLKVRVSTTDPTYTASVYRLGDYNGKGGRLVETLGTFPGDSQAAPSRNDSTALAWANWTISFNVTTSYTSSTGVYVVKLTSSSGKQNYVPFVVRSLGHSAKLLYHTADTTWHAYNAWGGSSLYGSDRPGMTRAYQVSYDRPFDGVGWGQLGLWELPMIRYLESQGHAVSYAGDFDLQNLTLLLRYRGLLTVGHDEYWTSEMRDNMEAARNASVNIASFAANSAYWQIRGEPSRIDNATPNRVVTGYKSAALDPRSGVDPRNATVRFRDAPVNRPESELWGTQYENNAISQAGYYNLTYTHAPAQLFVSAPAVDTVVSRVVGIEWDAMTSSTPAGAVVLATGAGVNRTGGLMTSHSIIWRAPSNAWVFAAGTIGWSNALDGVNGAVRSDAHRLMTANIIELVKGNETVLLPPPAPVSTNPIVTENAKPGTTAWRLTDPNAATSNAIKAYATQFSLAAGSELKVRVSTNATNYTADVYRLGYYAGAGGRLVASAGPFVGGQQSSPILDPTTNVVWAEWNDSFVVTVPATWTTGVYVAKLTTNTGAQNYVPFVVRSSNAPAPFLYHTSEFTWQAYNTWGGTSLNSSAIPNVTRAAQVSMDRPFDGDGLSDLAAWELPLITWLEKRGEHVDYAADIDIHQRPGITLGRTALIFGGLDEHWTKNMRENVIAARDAGVSLALFGAKAAYWQVRLEPSKSTNAQPDRTITSWRNRTDPLSFSDPRNATLRFRDPSIGLPESEIFGFQTDDEWPGCCSTSDFTVQSDANSAFRLGVDAGTTIPNAVGPYFDRFQSTLVPAAIQLLASGNVVIGGQTHIAHSLLFKLPSGAIIFGAGSVGWTPGLAEISGTPQSPAITRLSELVLESIKGNASALREPLVPWAGLGLNPIAVENLNLGTTGWVLTDPAAKTQTNIKGFATPYSVAPLDELSFYVHSAHATYSAEIYRIGWYAGMGGRMLLDVGSHNGQIQPELAVNLTTGLASPEGWAPSFTIQVGEGWPSGIYVLKLTTSEGSQNYVPFVVRDVDQNGNFLFHTNEFTWHAYNTYSGSSLRGPTASRADKVSLDRPFSGKGWGLFEEYELPFVRYLEKRGEYVDYAGDIDLATNSTVMSTGSAILTAGLGQFWTKSMRDGMDAARARGVNLAQFGALAGHIQARLEPDSSGTADKVLVAYLSAARDPLSSASPQETTVAFRDAPVSRPESNLWGIQWDESSPLSSAPFSTLVLASASALAVPPTQTSAPLVVGPLWATYPGGSPSANLTVIAEGSPKDSSNVTRRESTTLLRHKSGALVFDAGTLAWPRALEGWISTPVSGMIQSITDSILEGFKGNDSAILPPLDRPPTISLISPVKDALLTNDVNITGTAEDPEGRPLQVEVSIDGDEWRNASGTNSWWAVWNVSALVEGVHSVQARVSDENNTVATAAVTVFVGSIPNRAPRVTIQFPTSGGIVDRVTTFAGTATDPDDDELRVELRIDSGAWRLVAGGTDWALEVDPQEFADGDHSVVARVSDGTVTSLSPVRLFRIAPLNHAPELGILSPVPGARVTGLVAVRGTSSDPDLGQLLVEVRFAGGAWVPASGEGSWMALVNSTSVPNGQSRIEVRVFDGRDTTEQSIPVTVWNNPIEVENMRPGTTTWALTDVTAHTQTTIKGYGSTYSAAPGSSLTVHVNTTQPSYTAEVFRMGWYGGAGGRSVAQLGPFVGQTQPPVILNSSTRLVYNEWTPSFILDIGSEWVSGVYLIKLTASNGNQNYVPFVVRSTENTGDFLFHTNELTWEAYNLYGGSNLFKSTLPGTTTRAYKVSLDRPFNGRGWGYLDEYELPFLRYLESRGYYVDYAGDIDLSTNQTIWIGHKAVLTAGYGEYWTRAMRDGMEAARDRGESLGQFGAAAGLWQVRFEPSASGVANRVIVGYKGTNDPISASDPTNTTTMFRTAPVNRPEADLWGIQWEVGAVSPSSPRFFDATLTSGAADLFRFAPTAGTVVSKLVGVEWDRSVGSLPANVTLLATGSPTAAVGGTRVQQSVLWQPKGGIIFDAGTLAWPRALIGYSETPRSDAIRLITDNVLEAMRGNRSVLKGVNGVPEITLEYPLANSVLVGRVTVGGTIYDPDGDTLTVDVRVDNGSWVPAQVGGNWSFELNTSLLANGQHVVQARVGDKKNTSFSGEVVVEVNNVPNRRPTLRIDEPLDLAVVLGTVGIRGTATDPDGDNVSLVELRIGEGPWVPTTGTTNWAFEWNTTLTPNGTFMIQARANDIGGYGHSPTTNVTVSNPAVNRLPQIAITNPTPGSQVIRNVSIQGTATDPDDDPLEVSVRIDEGAWQTVTGTANWALVWNTSLVPNGLHNIQARAWDGRNATVTSNLSVTVNNTPNLRPMVRLDEPVDLAVVFGKVQVRGVATDPDGDMIHAVDLRIGNGSWVTTNGTAAWVFEWNTTLSPNGTFMLQARANDSGGYGYSSATNVTVANAAANRVPQIAITYPTEGLQVLGNVSIQGTASDPDADPIQVSVRIDDGAWQIATGTNSWSLPWNTSLAANGVHDIQARVWDGQDESVTPIVSVSVNNAPANAAPIIAIGEPTEGAVLAGETTFRGTATDPDGDALTLAVQIDGGVWLPVTFVQNWTLALNTTALSNGPHVMVARASDANHTVTTGSRNFTINNQALGPEVRISRPASNARVAGDAPIVVEATSPDNTPFVVDVRIDDGEWRRATRGEGNEWLLVWNTTLELNGLRMIGARVDDGAVIVESATIQVEVANPTGQSTPSIFIQTPARGATIRDTLRVQGTAHQPDGNALTVDVSIDGGAWRRADGSTVWALDINPAGLAMGEHSVEARVVDGTAIVHTQRRYVYVDRDAPNARPTIDIRAPTETTTIRGVALVTGTASDVDGDRLTVEVRVDGGPWQAVVGETEWGYAWNTTSLTNGVHALEARARDGGGDTLSPPRQVLVDNSPQPRAPNPIEIENARQGTTTWALTDASALTQTTVRGFAAPYSTAPGGDIVVRVHSNASSFQAQVYRMGWYGGTGGRLVANLGSFVGVQQSAAKVDSSSRLVWFEWTPSFTLRVGDDWATGVYLIKLTASNGSQTYVPFVVRSSENRGDFLFHTNELTWQAYNSYGGSSLFKSTLPGLSGRAQKVSFDRPFGSRGWGFLDEYELPLLRYLESRGEHVDYAGDLDLATNQTIWKGHKAILTAGYGEYWTRSIRDGMEQARASGVHLGQFGAVAGLWQVRLEPNRAGTPDRVIVGYKDTADPLYATDRPNSTVMFRDLGRPESELWGIMWEIGAVSPNSPRYFPMTFTSGGSTYFNTGPAAGSTASLVVGVEWDRYPTGTLPPGMTLLANATPTAAVGGTRTQQTVIWRHSSGALVFDAGTLAWPRALYGYAGTPASAGIQQITKNVLEAMKDNTTVLRVVPALPPGVTIATPRDVSTISGPLFVSGHATDPNGDAVTVEFRIDSGAWLPAIGANPFAAVIDSTTLSNGGHTLTVRATAAGQTRESGSIEIVVANTQRSPPTISIESPVVGAALQETETVRGNAADPAGAVVEVSMRVDDGPWSQVDGTSPWNFTLNTTRYADGFHTLQARARVGTIQNISSTVGVQFDNNRAPLVAIASPLAGAEVTGLLNIVGWASDADEDQLSLTLRIDEGEWTPIENTANWRVRLDTATLPNGEHKIEVRASDGRAEAIASVLVNLTNVPSNTLPTIRFTSPSEGEIILGTVTIRGEAADADGDAIEITFKIDDQPWESVADSIWTRTLDTLLLSDGPHVFYARASDANGSAEAWLNVTVQNDLPPTITITQPTPNELLFGTVTIRGQANDANGDPLSIEVRVGAGDWLVASGDEVWSIVLDTRPLANGTYNLEARATARGVVSLAAIDVRVVNPRPNVAPFISIVAPDADSRIRGILDVRGEASDGDGDALQIEVQIDGRGWAPADGVAAWALAVDSTTLEEGSHVLRARASDGFVTVVTPDLPFVVRNINSAPALTIDSPLPYAQLSGMIDVRGTSSDADADSLVIRFRADSQDWVTALGSAAWSVQLDTSTLTNGENEITVEASDGEFTTTRSVSVSVFNFEPNTPPGVEFVNRTAILAAMTTVELIAHDDDGDALTVQVSIDDSPWNDAEQRGDNWTYEFDSRAYANGDHVLRARATDGAAWTEDITAITISNDAGPSPPTLVVSEPLAGAILASDVIARGTASDPHGNPILVDVRLGAGQWVATTGGNDWARTLNTTNLPNGITSFQVRAKTPTGTSSAAWNVTINNPDVARPPSIIVTEPTSGASQSGLAFVLGTASDPDGDAIQVDVRIDGGPWTPAMGSDVFGASWNTTSYSSGTHTVQARARANGSETVSPVISVTIANAPPAPRLNPIAAENLKAGTTSWALTDASALSQTHLRAYGAPYSVAPGANVTLFVHSVAPSYRVDIYRTGWYGGAAGRLITTLGTFPGSTQSGVRVDSPTRMVSYVWNASLNVSVGSDWVSGVYLAKLTSSTGNQTYVPFVVRSAENQGDFLLHTNEFTWQAYNSFGGSNLFKSTLPGTTARATMVSMDRPFSGRGWGNFDEYEMPMIRYLESRGEYVDYAGDIDLSVNSSIWQGHKAVLTSGFSEYWTKSMRDQFEAARDRGVHLGQFGAAGGLWQVRLQPNATGVPNRVIVGYKDTADPVYATNPANATIMFRDLGRPEANLWGAMYEIGAVSPASPRFFNMTVREGASSFFTTAPAAGSRIVDAIGVEWDRLPAGPVPPGMVVLADGTPTAAAGGSRIQQTIIWRHANGSLVFDAGTLAWSRVLAGYGAPKSEPARLIAHNVLEAMKGNSSVLRDPVNRAPSVSMTSIVPGSVLVGPNYIRGVASDADGDQVSVSVRIDGGAWQPVVGSTAWVFPWSTAGVTNGPHTLQARASDGRSTTLSSIVSITIENPVNLAPFATMTEPTPGTVVSRNFTLRGTATDPDGDSVIVDVRFDGGPWLPATGDSEWSAMIEEGQATVGPHSVQSRVSDGSLVTISDAVPIVFANRAPTVHFTAPAPALDAVGIVEISGRAADPDGDPLVVHISLDTGPWLPVDGTNNWQTTIDFTELPRGRHALIARVTDGNITTYRTLALRTPDHAPFVMFDFPSPEAEIGGITEIRGSARDIDGDPIVVQLRVDNGDWMTVNGSAAWNIGIDFTQSSRGNHSLVAIARTPSGATENAIQVHIANRLPVVSINLEPNANLIGQVTVTGNASDADDDIVAISLRLDNGVAFAAMGVAPWTGTFNATALGKGAHILSVDASDGLGTTTITSEFYVPNSPPIVVIEFPLDAARMDGVVTVTGTVRDDDGDALVVRGRMDNGPWTQLAEGGTWEFGLDLATFVKGTHILTIEASDGTDVSMDQRSITIPNRAPTIVIDEPVSGVSLQGTIAVRGRAVDVDAEDMLTVRARVDQGAWSIVEGGSSWETTFQSADLRRGNHTIEVSVTDGEATTATSVTITIPNHVPTMTIDGPESSSTYDGLVTLTGHAADTDGDELALTVRVDNGEWSTINSTAEWDATLNISALAKGPHTIDVRASDGIDATSAAITILRANRLPAIMIDAPLGGAIITEGRLVQGRATDGDGDDIFVQIRVAQGDWIDVEGSSNWQVYYPFDALARGTYLIEASVNDGESATLQAISVVVPDHLPQISLNAPSVGVAVSGIVDIAGTAFDSDADDMVVEISLDAGQTWIPVTGTANWNYSWDSTVVGDGNIAIHARVEANGAYVETTREFRVDNVDELPEIILTTPATGETLSGTVDVVGTVFDFDADALTVEVSLDEGASWMLATLEDTNWSWSFDTTLLTDGTLTIRTRVSDATNVVEAVVTIEIDNPHMPTITITSPASGSVVGGDVVVEGTASDADGDDLSIELSLDGGVSWLPVASASLWSTTFDARSLPEGELALRLRVSAIDGIVTVDRAVMIHNDSPPVVIFTAPAPGARVLGAVSFEGNADDADNENLVVELSFDAGLTWQTAQGSTPWSFSWDSTVVADGPVTVLARATAANVSVIANRTLTVDNVDDAPVIIVLAPQEGETIAGVIEVGGTASDPQGDALTIEVSLDGGASWLLANGQESWTLSFNASTTLDGPFTLIARASANSLSSQVERVVVINNPDLPTIEIGLPAAGLISGLVTFSGTAADLDGDALVVELSLDGGASWVLAEGASEWSLSWDSTLTPDGDVALRARVTAAGDTQETTREFRVDNVDELPEIILTTPATGETLSGTVDVVGTVFDFDADALTVEVSLDEGASWMLATLEDTNWSWSFDTTLLTDGTLTIRTRVSDATNVVEAVVTIEIDNPHMPTITITSPEAGATLAGNVLVGGASADADGDAITVELSFDGGSSWVLAEGDAPWSYSWDTTQSPEGNAVVFVRVTAGADSGQITREFWIDNVNEAPVVSISSPVSGATVSGVLEVAGTSEDFDGEMLAVQVSMDGANWLDALMGNAGAWAASFDTRVLPDGERTLWARVTDGVLWSETSIQVGVDNPHFPTISFSSPAPGSVAGTIQLAGDATDIDDDPIVIQVSLDGGLTWAPAIGTATWTFEWDTTGSPEGGITVLARVTAGDDAAEASRAFWVDNVDETPILTVDSPTEGASVSGIVQLEGGATDFDDDPLLVNVSFDEGTTWQSAVLVAGNWTFSYSTLDSPDGLLSILVRATDGVSIAETRRLVQVYNPDPPTIEITAPSHGTVAGIIMIEGVAADPDGDALVVEVTLDEGVTWLSVTGSASWSFEVDTRSLEDGPLTIRARVSSSGDVNQTEILVSVQNNEEPAIEVIDTISGQTISENAEIAGSASDDSGLFYVQVSTDGGPWETFSNAASWSYAVDVATLSDGSHTIQFRVVDEQGRAAESAILNFSVSHSS